MNNPTQNDNSNAPEDATEEVEATFDDFNLKPEIAAAIKEK